MKELTKYKWFKYMDKRALELDCSDKEYLLGINPGDRFGYYKRGSYHYVVPRDDLTFQVRIRATDAARLLKNSTGWKGKIKGTLVAAGIGGKDKKVAEDPNIYVLDINSSNLESARYFKKEKELEVEFKNGAVWRYQEVTMRLAKAVESAESQGSFFYYKIRNVKPQYQVRK